MRRYSSKVNPSSTQLMRFEFFGVQRTLSVETNTFCRRFRLHLMKIVIAVTHSLTNSTESYTCVLQCQSPLRRHADSLLLITFSVTVFG
ncbi:hypothetical protein TNIN_433461 [Trichonephila inaurata madagascariensis]|uniref:Uncharacterized protein n=1 Tax=Trichonephila inaurata madagascariensis TaxID=2747483 RepID=A0A8X7BZL1_9ARAC|nr:hypothetical protein TNIN_433461 [Trichonephila inaurata madagascariensis]